MHEAADGGLARVRLPGGVLSASQLRVLLAAAVDLGDGHLELTSRANVQIRALRSGAPAELSDRLYAAGLLPSITHERVRNILASPLSGLDTPHDVLPLAAAVDRLLCATPSLAALPGRFLFALDDGRGDLSAAKADISIRLVSPADAELHLAGAPTGLQVSAEQVPPLMIAAAEAFLAERAAQGSEAWRLAELEEGPRRVLTRLVVTGTPLQGDGGGWARAGGAGECRVRAGEVVRVDGGVALVVTVPLGVLGVDQAEALAEVAGGQRAGGAQVVGGLRVTPWRSVVVADVQDVEAAVQRLVGVGLVVEAKSSWNGVTSCAGRPGCGKALGDVRGEARRVVPRVSGGRAVHWAGCERRCGRPAGEFVDVLALEQGGYSVDGVVGDVESLINRARVL